MAGEDGEEGALCWAEAGEDGEEGALGWAEAGEDGEEGALGWAGAGDNCEETVLFWPAAVFTSALSASCCSASVNVIASLWTPMTISDRTWPL